MKNINCKNILSKSSTQSHNKIVLFNVIGRLKVDFLILACHYIYFYYVLCIIQENDSHGYNLVYIFEYPHRNVILHIIHIHLQQNVPHLFQKTSASTQVHVLLHNLKQSILKSQDFITDLYIALNFILIFTNSNHFSKQMYTSLIIFQMANFGHQQYITCKFISHSKNIGYIKPFY